jgi:predicted kinase
VTAFFSSAAQRGKSTLAARLGAEPGCIILSEDQWLAALYPDQLHYRTADAG